MRGLLGNWQSYRDGDSLTSIPTFTRLPMTIVLSSPLLQRSFAARLKRRIFDSFRIKWYTIAFSWDKPVAGEVWTWSDNTIRFFIFKRRFIINALAPRLEGQIYSSPTGSTIRVNASLVRHIVWSFTLITFPVLLFSTGMLVQIYLNNQLNVLGEILHDGQFQLHIFQILVGLSILFLVMSADGAIELRYLTRFITEFTDQITS